MLVYVIFFRFFSTYFASQSYVPDGTFKVNLYFNEKSAVLRLSYIISRIFHEKPAKEYAFFITC